MDEFFIFEEKKRTYTKTETYITKELDQRKIYTALENAKDINDLIPLLKALQEDDDTECDHVIADEIVVKALIMLGQPGLAKEYEAVDKWYA